MKTNAKEYLEEFASSQENWLKALVYDVIETNGKVTNERKDKVLNSLIKGTELKSTKPNLSHETVKPEIRITKLVHTSGVNALKEGQTIEFSNDVTILYGLNGSGKSGYFRVFNEMTGGNQKKEIISNIYAEKNEGVFLLLKNFTNYFSLNYDSLLYLLSLKYKSSEKGKEDTTIIFQPSLKFIEDGLNAKQNGIYTEIKNARKNGKLKAFFDNKNNSLEKDFNSLTKTHFVALVKAYSTTYKKDWKEIDRIVRKILENEQEKKNKTLKVDDGGRQLNLFGEGSEYVFDTDSRTQNLFFLHGAFHIYKDGKSIKKITQQSDKALYERLEEILNNEKREIVCVFQSGDKENIINNNTYLKNCLKKLGEISGNIVIIGSSLADNDNHIFDKINNSTISTIYISVLPKERDKMMEIAKSKFSEKDAFNVDKKEEET